MKPDISEFSYGFALTAEWIETVPPYQLAGAPEFPSLYAEGQAGGGYDVHIPGIAVFLQFKLSEVLKRRNAKESGLVGVPYFRMRMRALRHSKQHRLLVALEGPDNFVYYAAPEFSTPKELNSAYLNRRTLSRTAFFRPADIGQLPDDEEHYVVFTARSPLAYLCSDEPGKVVRVAPEDVLDEVRRGSEKRATTKPADLPSSAGEFYSELLDRMVSVYGEVTMSRDPDGLKRLREPPGERSLATHAQYLSQTLFGCELLVA